MDQKKTGQFLRSLRNEKKITQEQLAQEFNVSSRSVSRWENGTNLPDISLLVEIADFYEVDVREIIDGERKNETMNEETREVADKMAAYAGNEKSKTLRSVQIMAIVGEIASITAIVLMTIGYEPGLKNTLTMITLITTLILMSVLTLYVTGRLEKVTKSKKVMKAVKISAIVLLVLSILYFLRTFIFLFIFFGILFIDSVFHKPETDTDITNYNKYIHIEQTQEEIWKNGYATTNSEMFDIWPEHITSDMNVTEFQYTYYNPWDAQYVIYMTAEYDPDAYDSEIERLSVLESEEYLGIYTVTGEPEGYDIVSMNSDEYHGFTYAMIPEGVTGNTQITYVSIWFCNYFLDLDVHKYIPDKYLLAGFNAENGNPYQEENVQKPEPLDQDTLNDMIFPDFK
ncbi:MAG: helix-turn-helix transcriptional regulator [Lachnospiraceae bacterium]|nr:helix-turn-helix transcriptional regulator [Lachnospiraceae bacterium]